MKQLVSGAMTVFLLSVTACGGRPNTAPSHNRSVITRDEIASVTGAADMYDVVQRLRAEYFRSRGTTSLVNPADPRPTVFLDNQEYGPIESLRNIQPAGVEEVRYFPGNSAVATFGSRYGSGVIQVKSRA
ncbi:MAG TPA: hypothetical protein VJ867_04300 [Gemmatimonadaceae bacterium]|nr:hypothetical protein [Gemmatimonadaceae bacterium]